MKKPIILFLLLWSTISISQQHKDTPWMKTFEGRQQDPTFEEVQRAFNTYWKTHDKDAKESGYKPFMNNLPNTNITDLEINLTNQSITAASYGRGLWRSSIDGVNGRNAIAPQASFSTVAITCKDEVVVLTDTSTNTPTAWQWSFSPVSVVFHNGTDATSQHPEVSFNTSGTYQIILTVTNAEGSNFNSNSIHILGDTSLPLLETFTTAVPPQDWHINNPDNSTTWEAVVTTGIGNNPTQVARIDNFSYNAAGQEDELVMPVVDLTTMVNPVLKFELAYASYDTQFFERLQIEFSTDCGVTFSPTTYDKAGSTLETHPPSTSGWEPTQGSHWRTETVELLNYSSANTILKFVQTTGYGNGLFIDDVRIEEGPFVAITPSILLQGASLNPNTGEELLMRDDLRVAGYIPTISPYSDGLTCDSAVLTTTGVNAIVDWVWVELRDGANRNTIISGQSALLQRNGDIVGVDGNSSIYFPFASADYHIKINHRNHLGISTENAISLSTTMTPIDFTSNSAIILGGNIAVTSLSGGRLALHAGDGNEDGNILNTDIVSALNASGTTGYLGNDADMDGFILNNDIQLIIQPNAGKIEQE